MPRRPQPSSRSLKDVVRDANSTAAMSAADRISMSSAYLTRYLSRRRRRSKTFRDYGLSNLYGISFAATICLQFFQCWTLLTLLEQQIGDVDHKPIATPFLYGNFFQDIGSLTVTGGILSVQTFQLSFATVHLLSRLHGNKLQLRHSGMIYVSTVIYFAGLYTVVFLSLPQAFKGAAGYASYVDDWGMGFSMFRVYVNFLYFATATQVSVGYGDICPLHPLAIGIADVQMVLGMLYSVYILGQTLQRLHKDDSSADSSHDINISPSRRPTAKFRSCIPKWTFDSCPILSKLATMFRVCWQRMVEISWLRKLRRWTRSFILPVTLAMQSVTYLTLCYGSDYDCRTFFLEENLLVWNSWAISILMVFELLNLVIIISTTSKFIHRTSELSLGFLFQTFLSVAITFAGIYVLMQAVATKQSPWSMDFRNTEYGDKKDFFVIVLEFVHFSLVTMTTVGYGDSYATAWFSQLAVTLQMLISVAFMEVLFGLGLDILTDISEANDIGFFSSPPASPSARSPLLYEYDSPGGSAYEPNALEWTQQSDDGSEEPDEEPGTPPTPPAPQSTPKNGELP